MQRRRIAVRREGGGRPNLGAQVQLDELLPPVPEHVAWPPPVLVGGWFMVSGWVGGLDG